MKKNYLIIGLVIAIIAYALFRGSYWIATLPGSCVVCHEIKPYFVSWKESPHSNVPCMKCHEKRGPFGKIENVLTHGIKGIVLQITGEFGSFKPGNESLALNNCITCHIGKIKSFKEAPLMPKDHLEMLKNDSSCINCHRNTGHKTGLGADTVSTKSK